MPAESNRAAPNSVIDHVISSQQELGPKVPDGGYGWVVFTVTLFFQVSKISTFQNDYQIIPEIQLRICLKRVKFV